MSAASNKGVRDNNTGTSTTGTYILTVKHNILKLAWRESARLGMGLRVMARSINFALGGKAEDNVDGNGGRRM